MDSSDALVSSTSSRILRDRAWKGACEGEGPGDPGRAQGLVRPEVRAVARVQRGGEQQEHQGLDQGLGHLRQEHAAEALADAAPQGAPGHQRQRGQGHEDLSGRNALEEERARRGHDEEQERAHRDPLHDQAQESGRGAVLSACVRGGELARHELQGAELGRHREDGDERHREAIHAELLGTEHDGQEQAGTETQAFLRQSDGDRGSDATADPAPLRFSGSFGRCSGGVLHLLGRMPVHASVSSCFSSDVVSRRARDHGALLLLPVRSGGKGSFVGSFREPVPSMGVRVDIEESWRGVTRDMVLHDAPMPIVLCAVSLVATDSGESEFESISIGYERSNCSRAPGRRSMKHTEKRELQVIEGDAIEFGLRTEGPRVSGLEEIVTRTAYSCVQAPARGAGVDDPRT